MKKEKCINILNKVCSETITKYDLDVSCHFCSVVDYWFSKEFRDSFKEKNTLKGKINEVSFPLKSATAFSYSFLRLLCLLRTLIALLSFQFRCVCPMPSSFLSQCLERLLSSHCVAFFLSVVSCFPFCFQLSLCLLSLTFPAICASVEA